MRSGCWLGPTPPGSSGLPCTALAISPQARYHSAPFFSDPILGTAMKTFSAKGETVQRDWYVVDAAGKTLGRLSSELALRLRGKHKPVFTPHVDRKSTRLNSSH